MPERMPRKCLTIDPRRECLTFRPHGKRLIVSVERIPENLDTPPKNNDTSVTTYRLPK